MNRPAILILDDSQRVVFELKTFFDDLDYIVHTAHTPSQAFEILNQNHIDILILDIRLPEMDGLQVLKKVKELFSDMEIIMISGHGDMDKVITAMRLGASDFFTKPFQLIEIQRAIEQSKKIVLLNQQLKTVENKYVLLSQELHEKIGHELIGRSKAIKSVVSQMEKAAQSDKTPVLIAGESGTGKELVARGIHFLSQRKENFFYPANCSAISPELFESEVFGHVKGAFTGAVKDKPGWFETAHKGTLFLDEIGDMPPAFQPKLLRVLEDGKVRRVGSIKEIEFDVRIFSATNKKIQNHVREKKFRKDLFHRLNAFEIHIPPLRERKEDIPLLVEYYVQYYSKKMNRHITKISSSVMEKLCDHQFEGNVRELKNLVERAVIVCEQNEIKEKHFPGIQNNTALQSQCDESQIPYSKSIESFDLVKMEEQMIIKALTHCENNKTKAAKLLNISWSALHRKIQKYKINSPEK